MNIPSIKTDDSSFIKIKKQIKNFPVIGWPAKIIWRALKTPYKKVIKPSYSKYQHLNAANALRVLMRKIEYYQPLYNFPLEDNRQPQRICLDRAETIYKHINGCKEGDRILDIGCSLGYFPHYFAERGYSVSGIDNDPKNIDVCNLLARLNKREINFSVAEFSNEFLKKVNVDQYDIVFLFSVLHHVTYYRGLEYAQDLMVELLNKIPIIFVELAIQSEETTAAWKNSLPENELAVFAKCENIHIEKIGTFSNHLSSVKRPLYMVKKNTTQFRGDIYKVDERKFTPYQGAPYSGRSYYTCGNVFIKKYRLSFTKDNETQILQEIDNYRRLPENNYFPCFLSYQQDETAIAIMLSKLPGENLYDLLINKQPVPTSKIFSDIVDGLGFLLQQGLYHNDIRLWNVMLDGEKTYLFDLGMANKKEKENTNLALQWIIVSLHHFEVREMLYPLTNAPDLNLYSFSPLFNEILEKLQSTESFENFLSWWQKNRNI